MNPHKNKNMSQIFRRARRRAPLLAVCASLLAMAGAHAQTPATAAGSPQPQTLTLKQAVNLALQRSRVVALANLQYDLAKRQANVRRSDFLPNLFAGSGAAYTNGFPLVEGGGAPAIFSLSYQQSLFDRLANSQVKVAEQTAEQQRLAAQDASNTIAIRAASSYLELAKTRRELDLMKRGRDSAQKILDFTKDRAGAGYELPIEVTKAQLTSARIEQRIAVLEDQEDTLTEQLRSMLGYPQDAMIQVATEDLPAEADQSVDAWEAQALRNNVAIKQAETEHQSSLAQLKGERGGRWPTISLIGQYNVLARFNNYDQFFDRFQRNNVIGGIDVKIPVFSSRASAAISFAQTNANATQMAIENKRNEVSLDVRHKARVVKEADTSRQVAQLELDLAQQNLQVLQAQFQQGRASVRDLESAQLDENDKWLAFLDSDFARQQAQLDLLQTTGQVATLFQ
jgi:outer membrane protein